VTWTYSNTHTTLWELDSVFFIAVSDCKAVMEILSRMIEDYDDIGNTVDELASFSDPREPNWVDEKGQIITDKGPQMNFGKYSGCLVSEVNDREYLEWVLRADFDASVKAVIKQHQKILTNGS
tara:strand:- start:789 stop:1157 length:369 start_codon:yes stop_codon:yes gene_type:complete